MLHWSRIPEEPWSCFLFQKVAGFEPFNFDRYWPVLTDR
jgi:hypothetical protein